MLIHRLRESSKSWHGVKLNRPDWSHSSHGIALSAEIVKNRLFLHWILKAWREPLSFDLPTNCGQWNRWIDTALESPEDIVDWGDVRPVPGGSCLVAPHSVVVLFFFNAPAAGSAVRASLMKSPPLPPETQGRRVVVDPATPPVVTIPRSISYLTDATHQDIRNRICIQWRD